MELKAARDEHATAAGTRMREESRFKVAQMEEADAAIEAAIAKTTNISTTGMRTETTMRAKGARPEPTASGT